MNAHDIQSKSIQWLRFPLSLAIVFLHCSSSPYEDDAIYSFIRQFISSTICGVAVPIFFFISGFLFFLNIDHFSISVYFNKLKNRVRSLLIPYILWNIIAAFLPFLILIAIVIKNAEPIDWLFDYLQGLNGWHMFWDYNHWGECAYGPIDLPLWFIRDLMVICLMSPLINYFIKKADWIFLIIIGALYVLSYWYYLNFNTRALLFFSLGAYLAINKVNLVIISKKYRCHFLLLALILSVSLTIYKTNSLIFECVYHCFVIIVLFVLVNVGVCFIEKGKGRVMMHLSQASFFIFAVHEIKVSEICEQLSDKLIYAQDTFSLIMHYFFFPILVTCISVSLYFVMKAVGPKLLYLLTGNRTVNLHEK